MTENNNEEKKTYNRGENLVDMTKDYNENERPEDETKDVLDGVGNKIKSGAKAVANKVGDTSKDLGTEYKKENLE